MHITKFSYVVAISLHGIPDSEHDRYRHLVNDVFCFSWTNILTVNMELINCGPQQIFNFIKHIRVPRFISVTGSQFCGGHLWARIQNKFTSIRQIVCKRNQRQLVSFVRLIAPLQHPDSQLLRMLFIWKQLLRYIHLLERFLNIFIDFHWNDILYQFWLASYGIHSKKIKYKC